MFQEEKEVMNKHNINQSSEKIIKDYQNYQVVRDSADEIFPRIEVKEPKKEELVAENRTEPEETQKKVPNPFSLETEELPIKPATIYAAEYAEEMHKLQEEAYEERQKRYEEERMAELEEEQRLEEERNAELEAMLQAEEDYDWYRAIVYDEWY